MTKYMRVRRWCVSAGIKVTFDWLVVCVDFRVWNKQDAVTLLHHRKQGLFVVVQFVAVVVVISCGVWTIEGQKFWTKNERKRHGKRKRKHAHFQQCGHRWLLMNNEGPSGLNTGENKFPWKQGTDWNLGQQKRQEYGTSSKKKQKAAEILFWRKGRKAIWRP